MKRRNSENMHHFSDQVFRKYKIYDLQGLLSDDGNFTCGVECYTIENDEEINPQFLNFEEENARIIFCQNLEIPYYNIFILRNERTFHILETHQENEKIVFKNEKILTEEDFLKWWRKHQSFTQTKEMYDAAARISESIVDEILFQNNLAWGVNVDGFRLSTDHKVAFIIEKRLCNPKLNKVEYYDPQKYFHGTKNRKGDYPAWKALMKLSEKLQSPLLLITFEKNEREFLRITRILKIDSVTGLQYSNPLKLYDGISNNLRDEIVRLVRET